MPKLTNEELQQMGEDPSAVNALDVQRLIEEIQEHRKSSYYERGHRLHKAEQTIAKSRRQKRLLTQQRDLLQQVLFVEHSISKVIEMIGMPENEGQEQMIGYLKRKLENQGKVVSLAKKEGVLAK